MEIGVSIEEKFTGCPKVGWLRKVVRRILEVQNVNAMAELSLVITGQERIHELNKAYLRKDRPTDVLSFPMLTELAGTTFVTAPDGKKHLGEVIISYPQAVIQAEAHGHSVELEIATLIIHGVLHLLGYDHERVAAGKEMRAREAEIMNSLLAGR